MNFKPHTKDELKKLNLVEDKIYTIEYLNKDYFNGEDTLEITKAKMFFNDDKFIFIVPDPYGMDRFITNVRVIL
ncbi:MAG: hypothetical protein U9R39_03760 [Campylobacterota bacterium]|nr:hypothetical protein [Campylobacterota bacterium]